MPSINPMLARARVCAALSLHALLLHACTAGTDVRKHAQDVAKDGSEDYLCPPRLLTDSGATVWGTASSDQEGRGTACPQNGGCTGDLVCKAGAWTLDGAELYQTCQPRDAGGVGTWCRGDAECAEGLICAGPGGRFSAPPFPGEAPQELLYRRCLGPCESCAIRHAATCDAAQRCQATKGCAALSGGGSLSSASTEAATAFDYLLRALQDYCPGSC